MSSLWTILEGVVEEVPTFTSVDLCLTSVFYMQETDFVVPLSLLQMDLNGSHRMQSG